MTRRFAAALLALAALTGGACGPRGGATPPGYLRVAIANGPTNLDPRVGIDEASQRVHQLVFSPLFRLDERLDVVPHVATGYTMPDDRTYLVTLRTDVRFHDGRLLTAADVVHTFRSFLDPAFVSGRKGAYRVVQAVDAVDPSTVRFTLKEPFASFPINLVMGIVPAGAADLAATPIGSGPYAFERLLPDDRVELRRFEEYFEGPAANAGIVLAVVPDDTMRGLELRKGTIDLVLNDLSPDIVRDLEARGEVRVTRSPGCDYAYMGLNLRDPILRDVRVRQALAHAIDRRAIVDHLRRGLAEPAKGILPPSLWAYEPAAPEFVHDPARAKALLDDAGYRDPDGDGPRARLHLTLKTSNAEFVRLQATVIQQDLRRVGVDVEVRSFEFATFLSDVIRGNFQMCTLQWVGVADPDMLRRVYHSAQVPPAGWNRGFFSDPEVDALIEQASRTPDRAAQKALYSEAQRRIAAAVPAVSLWHKTNVIIAQPDIAPGVLTPIADLSFLRTTRRVAGTGRGSATEGPRPAAP
jgi:peptide/nickel transport system substrate-binding protein